MFLFCIDVIKSLIINQYIDMNSCIVTPLLEKRMIYNSLEFQSDGTDELKASLREAGTNSTFNHFVALCTNTVS